MHDESNEIVRAPWRLTGRGYVLVHFPSRRQALEGGFIPPDLRDRFVGGPGAVMLVDYASSNVGPYYELLYVPGLFRFGRKLRFSITRVFVSSEASVRSGRANWGIPKERADFEWRRHGDSDHVLVHLDGRTIADLQLRALKLRLPISTVVIPKRLRTFAQTWDGNVLCVSPNASGTVGLARLVSATIDPAQFPDFSQARVVTAHEISRFEMEFPVAEVSPK